MLRPPPRSTRTYPLFPYPSLCRSRFGCAHEDCAPIEGREARCSPSIRQACLALLVLSAHIPIRQAAEEQSHFRLFVPVSLTDKGPIARSEEHTSELQSLMRISYAVFCLKKKKQQNQRTLNIK